MIPAWYFNDGKGETIIKMSGIKKENTVIGIILLIFSIYYAYLAGQLPSRNSPNTLGANFMPFIFAGFLAFLSVLLIVEGFVKNCEGASSEKIPRKKAWGIVLFFAILLGYVFAMAYLSYLIFTPIVLAAFLYMGGSRKPLEIILVSVIVTGSVYYLFHVIFNVPI